MAGRENDGCRFAQPFFDHEEGLLGNLLRVLSTIIVSSLVASIGFAQDAKPEKTGRHRSIGSERKEAADAAVADSLDEQAEEPVEMVVGSPPMVSDDPAAAPARMRSSA
jgi:hypothetical protein